MPLLDKKLILVVGKGGVGRSLVSATLANAFANEGRRTLLFEHDAVDRYGSWFETAPVGPELTELKKNLFAINTTPSAAMEEYGLMVLRWRRVYKMIFENRITRNFLRAVPGLNAYSILGKAWYHTTETRRDKSPKWDTVVFDMAASGHCLTMLKLPQVILNTVPEGPLTRDARKVQSLLLDEARTAVVMVTLPEEMPTNEAIELKAKLKSEIGVNIQSLVINQTYPNLFAVGSEEDIVLNAIQENQTEAAKAVVEHSLLMKSRSQLHQKYKETLRNAFNVPIAEIKKRFATELTSAEIGDISAALFSQLAA